MTQTGSARLAKNAKDYEKLGIAPRDIALWEDGQRAATDPGNYEWWYFDSHLDDGTVVVVVFLTKPIARPDLPLSPYMTISITDPSGKSIDKFLSAPVEEFSAAQDSCDVRIGNNRFVGDLKTYRITATIDEVSVDIELTSDVPAWRPRSGYMYFEHEGEPDKTFSWLPSVPQGKVKIKYSIGDQSTEARGIGYHDHNWGDAPMPAVVHNWYWARAKVGSYTAVASYITATQKYGYAPVTIFLLAKDGSIVVDDESKVRFTTEDNFTDEVTGKPVANVSTYIYSDQGFEYVVKFKRQATILQDLYADKFPFAKRMLAKLLGLKPSYMRLAGSASVEKRVNGETVERFEEPAVWEQMYLGRTRPPAV